MRQTLILLLFGITVSAHCQNSGIFERITAFTAKHGTSIRKTFEGSSKDENKPATFFLNRNLKDTTTFRTIDVGVVVKQWALIKGPYSRLVVFPKFEWHADTRESGKKNNIGGGANFEFNPIPAKPKGDSEAVGWPVAPWFQGSWDMKEDKIKRETVQSFKTTVSLFSAREFWPGDPLKVNKTLVFRYYPYFGPEYFFKETREGRKEALFWTKRIFFELWPVPISGTKFVQITFDYSRRHSQFDTMYKRSSIEWLSAGLNVFPDGKGKVGLGVEFASGEDPSANFSFVRKVQFGLKVNY